MKSSISAALIAATATTILAFISPSVQVQAQGTAAGPRPAPQPGHTVNLLYSNSANDDVGSDDVPFNACFASETAFKPYVYLTFGPKNATINFYKDSNCQDFTFGLNGYYGGYPGQARSFRWVGWSEDTLGELFLKPIAGQGEAAIHPGGPPTAPIVITPPPPPTEGGGHPNNPPPPPSTTNPDQETGGNDNSTGPKYKRTPTFFGVVFLGMAVLSIGALIYWRTASKKEALDKGKGLLPSYGRGATRDDEDEDNDILLTTHNRSHLNNDDISFSIGDGEDSDDDEEDRRHVRRDNNGVGEEEEEDHEDMREQKPRAGQHDRYSDDDDHA
ncbi:hypothetical protein BGZ97_002748 [Linnemannia gamsii]|jgi:hypothetical protein|uniref:Uncharacterized protein n=1 Tax=Linnemannia gamsii TaxID=64522 RepID=A0A9P6QVK7_9FUNG|nr:hypothetical protein BGZ97_002748 [Linnemannia gamsii]